VDDRFGRFREIPLALGQKGHKVQGLCLSYANKNEGFIKDGPVLWKSINATRLKLPGLLRFVIEAQKLAKESDIIWACSDSFYGVIGCAFGKMYKVPTIFDIYDNFGKFFVARLPVLKQLYHWAIRKSDAITSFSIPFSKYLTHNHPSQKKIYTIENAVNHSLFKPLNKSSCRQSFNLPSGAFIIGTAGALYKSREVDLLFNAFQGLKTKYKNLHIAVAGPRDDQLDIPDDPRIHDMGVLPFERVPLFLNSLDTAVICYANDEFGKICFPQKTFESMACDIPIVASNVGYLSYLFKNNKNWLYSPGDLNSLTNAIIKRMEDRSTGYNLPPTWNDSAKSIEKLMFTLLNKHKKYPRHCR